MTHIQLRDEILPWLPVLHNDRRGRIFNGPAVNDDTYAPLTCTWYDNLVRIATMGEGSCFIHAVLKAFFREYQENNSAKNRFQLVMKMRRDLAIALGLENPQYPGHTYWETANRGAFPRILMQELMDEDLIEILDVDYSINGLQRLFNSFTELGDEVYGFVSDVLNVDIYILRATQDNLYPHSHTHQHGLLRNAIVIIGNKYHYEVLAVNGDNGFQTIFPPDDPFLQALDMLFIGNIGLNDERNIAPYDPDETFIENIIDIFVINGMLIIPDTITNRLHPTNPFRMQLDRLSNRIQHIADVLAIR